MLGGTKDIFRAGGYNFFLWKKRKIINWEQDFLYTIKQCQQLRE
jgi:hypothetical protein